MNYEEKYKNALRWIESIYPTLSSEQRMEAEGIFPEVAESADERIRKAIIEHLRQDIELEQILSEEVGSDWIAWLEKQGEQKFAWSEEDKRKLNWVINVWNRLRRGGDAQTTPSQMEMLEDWLKSLKERTKNKEL